MPIFSKYSTERLDQCYYEIQMIMNEAIKYFDFKILCGYRGEEEQNRAYNQGNSELKYPDSKHNLKPAMAVDIQPYPANVSKKYYYYQAGIIMAIAKQLLHEGKIKHRMRWGGDWDSNHRTKNKFEDLGHFEILW